jgi:site-specific recombinase XerD
VRVIFPVRKEIEDILQRYRDPGRGYLLPILDENIHITGQQQLDRIHKVRGQVNTNLKIIGRQLDVEGLTSYWARHTYASYMFRQGMPVTVEVMDFSSARHTGS